MKQTFHNKENRTRPRACITLPVMRAVTTFFGTPANDSSLMTIFAAMKILMVCLGNICRSPLAEGLLQHKAFLAGLKWSVESAGTNGYNTGCPPHSFSQKIALQYGINISTQRSRTFIPEDFERFDKIYAMAEDVIEEMKFIAKKKYDASKVDMLLNELYPGQNIDVPDPWNGPEQGYHEVFTMIDSACEIIVRKYSARNSQLSTFPAPGL